jgi:DNA-directed RNA polymerase subunit RPC12/RpoP
MDFPDFAWIFGPMLCEDEEEIKKIELEYNCLRCKDRGFVESFTLHPPYKEIAIKEGSLQAGWLQMHDLAFPYTNCPDCNEKSKEE